MKHSIQSYPSVNLIGIDNGVGISRDVQLMAAALERLGCDVAVTQVDRSMRRRRRSILVQGLVRAQRWLDERRHRQLPRRFDINVMFEHAYPEQLAKARCNVLLPNPEWFDRRDRRFFDCVDHVWAKTERTAELFHALGRPVTWIGFDSEDRLDATVPRERMFFHLAGRSPTKGTARLAAMWARHPEWPVLTVVQSRESAPALAAANVNCRTEYVADAALRHLQNAHAYHLCPSETEGWGHYIAEALSAGAVTVTLDAAPMNELVTPERGVLLAPARPAGMQCLATMYHFEEAALVDAVERALRLTPEERAALAAAGRDWFVENKNAFAQRLERGIAAALAPPVVPATSRRYTGEPERGWTVISRPADSELK